MKRDFLTIWDLSADEIRSIVDRALKLKRGEDGNMSSHRQECRLLFEKVFHENQGSFETGIYQLGHRPST